MDHVVTTVDPAHTSRSGAFEVHLVPSWRDNLVWIIAPVHDDTAWIVDGPEAEGVLAWCAAHGRRLAGILNTHTHPDHVGVNADLARRGLLDGMQVIGSARAKDTVPGLTHPVDEGDTFELSGYTVQVLATDGHQDGHLTFVLDGMAFTGDTLFAGGCGYLFDGPASAMFRSLLRLAALPADTLVFCAHEYTEDNLRFAWLVEPDNRALAERIRDAWAVRAQGRCTVPSTIGLEQATNPFLRPGSPGLREQVAAHMPDAELSDAASTFAATRKLKDRKDHRALTDADLPLG